MPPELDPLFEITTKKKTAEILLKTGCVIVDFQKGFTFSSGIRSPIKIDCEKLDGPNSSKELIFVLDELQKLIGNNYSDFDFLCGVIKGGAVFTNYLSPRLKKPAVVRLGKKQDEERRKMVTGQVLWGSDGIIIEDVLTKGTNTKIVADQIRVEGACVNKMATIFDYEFDEGKRALEKYGIKHRSLTNFNNLLQSGRDLKIFDNLKVNSLTEWWQKVNLQNL